MVSVQVYWEEERKWFVGTVRDFEESTRFHLVVYDDGDQRHEDFEDPTLEWSVVDLAHSANSQSSMEGRDQAVMMHESSGMPAESRATAPIREQSKIDPSYLCGSSQPLWRFKAEPKKLTHEERAISLLYACHQSWPRQKVRCPSQMSCMKWRQRPKRKAPQRATRCAILQSGKQRLHSRR